MSDETARWLYGLGTLIISWFLLFVWNNYKSLQDLRKEIAKDYPTWIDMKTELQDCSDQKDRMIDSQKEDLKYIRARVDMLVNRELDKKESL